MACWEPALGRVLFKSGTARYSAPGEWHQALEASALPPEQIFGSVIDQVKNLSFVQGGNAVLVMGAQVRSRWLDCDNGERSMSVTEIALVAAIIKNIR